MYTHTQCTILCTHTHNAQYYCVHTVILCYLHRFSTSLLCALYTCRWSSVREGHREGRQAYAGVHTTPLVCPDHATSFGDSRLSANARAGYHPQRTGTNLAGRTRGLCREALIVQHCSTTTAGYCQRARRWSLQHSALYSSL